jgi:predicted neuraminidase
MNKLMTTCVPFQKGGDVGTRVCEWFGMFMESPNQAEQTVCGLAPH